MATIAFDVYGTLIDTDGVVIVKRRQPTLNPSVTCPAQDARRTAGG